MICGRLEQQSREDINPEDYKDSYQWCNRPYSTKKNNVKAFHLSINHSITGLQHLEHKNIKQHVVDHYLDDMSYDELIEKHHSFQTLVYAITTVDRLQDLERLQPQLTWKPLEVIRRTLQATTQCAKSINNYPLKDHHISR